MTEIFEAIMLVCFGLSWPISVWKSYRSRSTRGKSPVFIIAIITGYLSGIAGKIAAGGLNYVFAVYCINLVMVCADLLLYFRNRRLELRNEKESEIL